MKYRFLTIKERKILIIGTLIFVTALFVILWAVVKLKLDDKLFNS